jgi:FkbM family methyltransferase
MTESTLRRISRHGFTRLSRVLGRFGHRVERFDEMNFFEPLLYRRLAKSENFFFVQIGANDGISADPIRTFVTRNEVAGLVVEPLRDIFEKLVFNYRDFPKIKPINVALHQSAKSVELHRVDPSKGAYLEGWVQGIASLKADHHTLSRTPGNVMVAETVPCVTLTQLLDENRVTHLDLLQIDTEGYDGEIIRMIDFSRTRPAIIRFEHGLPDSIMSLAEFKECVTLLIDQGYYIVTEPYDSIAYLPVMI